MTDSHEKRCDKIVADLRQLVNLVLAVKQGCEKAAKQLQYQLGHFSYEGTVIHISVDSIIANVLDKESD